MAKQCKIPGPKHGPGIRREPLHRPEHFLFTFHAHHALLSLGDSTLVMVGTAHS
jgi:hypothetical protein